MPRWCWLLPILLAVAIAAACGPSIRRTYQSDNAFQRCFDFDYNSAKSSDDKRECWSTWLDEYVYNQPEDKVAYAELRLKEIADGISVPGPPGPNGSFDRRPEPVKDVEPTGEAVEPAAPADQEPDAGPAEDGDGGAAELPAGDCEAACKSSYTPCNESCAEAESNECSTACEAGYKSCMRNCFAE
jgi:hypothetical protein